MHRANEADPQAWQSARGPSLPAGHSHHAGRGLCDDVMDVILTLATNTALGDGVAPDMRLMRPDFPYFESPTLRRRVPRSSGDDGVAVLVR